MYNGAEEALAQQPDELLHRVVTHFQRLCAPAPLPLRACTCFGQKHLLLLEHTVLVQGFEERCWCRFEVPKLDGIFPKMNQLYLYCNQARCVPPKAPAPAPAPAPTLRCTRTDAEAR